MYGLARFGVRGGAEAAFEEVERRARSMAVAVEGLKVHGMRVCATRSIVPKAGECFSVFACMYRTVFASIGTVGTPAEYVPWNGPRASENASRRVCESRCGNDPERMTTRREKVTTDGCESLYGQSRTGSDVLPDLRMHMQRKMIGFLRKMFFEIQDFVKVMCAPDDKGEISERKKRWMASLMKLSTPLAHKYADIVGGELRRVLAYGGDAEHDSTDSVVYVRWNLEREKVIYVGETSRWQERIGEHYRKTLKHQKEECKIDKCAGCAEHAKYKHHNPVPAAGWFTTVVRSCAPGAKERKLLEERIIRAVNPLLNRMVKKYPVDKTIK